MRFWKDCVVILYFDATGSLFVGPPGSKKRVFYYCMVLEGDAVIPPVASLEFITNGHSAFNIHQNLAVQVDILRKLSPKKWPIVNIIETDFSKAMIQAACKAFNNWDLQVYLDKSFDKIINPNLDIPLFTLIHVCATHLKRAAVKKI